MQLNNTASLEKTDGVLRLGGSLNAKTAVRLQIQGQQLIQQLSGSGCTIDLSGVTDSSSVGVALLTVWLRFAKAEGKTIHFQNMPKPMLDMIELSGLDQLLVNTP